MAINKEKNTQIPVIMSHELHEEIVNFQFEHRVKNKAEAIRQLIKMGLEAAKKDQEEE
ncbi:hypothetical protein ABEY46_19430 [Bacillus velezensis]|uniref:hypothetical protein n=1 Tax=Bacillus TaxID=1386 RepID=UPI00164311C5|nr:MULTISPECIES: hypothetical protein [Bacillus]MCX2854264.1 hypothetical protein [Bacillus sp. KeR2]MCZ4246640.1 hypothetical protein [Bacillus amyloliquefaciens]MEC3796972.1 hypothetical protein [Bacillus velezensis]MED4526336.1 hypothetical protein [Bacillus velezensis]